MSEELKEKLFDLIDEHFPKHECKERGQAMVLVAQAILAFEVESKRVEIKKAIDELQRVYDNYKLNPVKIRLDEYKRQLDSLENGGKQ